MSTSSGAIWSAFPFVSPNRYHLDASVSSPHSPVGRTVVDWANLETEQRNPNSDRIDEASALEICKIINREDAGVARAVEGVLPAIAAVMDLVADALRAGGRLFYLGAGTSGRLGVLDASECPPTYNTDPSIVQGVIAGGDAAVFSAVEGAEDDAEGAVEPLSARQLRPPDVVLGIAASGVTPFVIGGLRYARECTCRTVLLCCSPVPGHGTSRAVDAGVDADACIVVPVGPEVITGSTRMKAGTATKMVLNMITTGAMVLQGKTFGNLMVDLQPKSAKLRDRSKRILSTLTGLDPSQASVRLTESGWDLKLALVMELCDLELEAARERLRRHDGHLKRAVGDLIEHG